MPVIGDSNATLKKPPTRRPSFGFGRKKKVDTTPGVKIGAPVPVQPKSAPAPPRSPVAATATSSSPAASPPTRAASSPASAASRAPAATPASAPAPAAKPATEAKITPSPSTAVSSPASAAKTTAPSTAASKPRASEPTGDPVLDELGPFLNSCNLARFLLPLTNAGIRNLPELSLAARKDEAKLLECGLKPAHTKKLQRSIEEWRANGAGATPEETAASQKLQAVQRGKLARVGTATKAKEHRLRKWKAFEAEEAHSKALFLLAAVYAVATYACWLFGTGQLGLPLDDPSLQVR